MIARDELELVRKALGTDEDITLEEQSALLMVSRRILNKIRYTYPIDDQVHNACAGVYHVFDWPWNELMEKRRMEKRRD